MEYILKIIDIFIHLDKYLVDIIARFGHWTYLILFLVIFCETGLVVTPILPGDSLLFAAGAMAALGSFNVFWLFAILSIAAVLGDTVNYWIGYFVGPKIFHKEKVKFLKKEYLERTHNFYEKHGGKTIIIARFMPIIRTFAPFVAGIGKMSYWKFVSYNVIGGIAWIAIFVFGGYYFGNIPTVKKNFTLVILVIIFLSILPGIIEYIRHRIGKKKIMEILSNSKTIAVVGLSPDKQKPSNLVAGYLKTKGYRIIPVNPNCTEIFGEKCYPNLKEIPFDVDIVNIFRKPEFIPEIVDEAIDKKARVVWMQLKIIHNDAAKKAQKSGLQVIMDKCMYIEHKKLFG